METPHVLTNRHIPRRIKIFHVDGLALFLLLRTTPPDTWFRVKQGIPDDATLVGVTVTDNHEVALYVEHPDFEEVLYPPGGGLVLMETRHEPPKA